MRFLDLIFNLRNIRNTRNNADPFGAGMKVSMSKDAWGALYLRVSCVPADLEKGLWQVDDNVLPQLTCMVRSLRTKRNLDDVKYVYVVCDNVPCNYDTKNVANLDSVLSQVRAHTGISPVAAWRASRWPS
jgi:hypothetical protein